jgi:hypothetical protein
MSGYGKRAIASSDNTCLSANTQLRRIEHDYSNVQVDQATRKILSDLSAISSNLDVPMLLIGARARILCRNN